MKAEDYKDKAWKRKKEREGMGREGKLNKTSYATQGKVSRCEARRGKGKERGGMAR